MDDDRDRLAEIEAVVLSREHACSKPFGDMLTLSDGCDACLMKELLSMANGSPV